ncbi:MAG: manganese efflux pump [Oscillospiraceae bacterium]|nr:manganese efflux pump [Oscillospiraceae bacterium]
MDWNIMFFANSVLLGLGLAMDAFSVSLANGLHEPKMKTGRMCAMAGIFAAFQYIMPMIGWFCVHTIAHYFSVFEKFIPWIALILLCYIGISMIKEAKECEEEEGCSAVSVGFGGLIVQGIATSIDALSVGFTIADYNFLMAFTACMLIGIVTFFICFAGIELGKKFGTKLAGRASVFGGAILIFIGIEIFITGVF